MQKQIPTNTAVLVLIAVAVVVVVGLALMLFTSDPAGKGKRPATPIQRGNIQQLNPGQMGGGTSQ